MNAILRSSVAVWSIAFIATTIPASLLSATPLRYQIDLAFLSSSIATPFDGATLKLDLTWDASTLPLPAFGGGWSTSNTTGSLTVMGSAAVDGVYSPTFPYPDGGSRWTTYNQGAFGDYLAFPDMWFEIGGETVALGGNYFIVRFGDTFFDGPRPWFPKPFEPADVKWKASDIFPFRPPMAPKWVGNVVPVSASARYAPEPSTLALGSFALLSLAALRRRK